MQPRGHRRGNSPGQRGLVFGVVIALLISIPVWVAAGLALAWAFQVGPITQTQSALLMVAAAAELILLRYALRLSGVDAKFAHPAGRGPAVLHRGRWSPMARQTLMLSVLVASYLHYYFWDVHLQIASMHSVTVFVPSARVG
jgi:hypothetical protein